MYRIAFKSILASLGLTLFTFYGFSQSLNTYSPYSRYGIGVLSQPGFSQNRALAGISQAYRSETVINFNNPASYSQRDSMSFLFDFGIETNTSSFNGYDQYLNSQRTSNSAGGIHHIAFSFPISRRIGFSAGVTPYSFVGYKLIRFETDPITLSTIGRIKYTHTGRGGINQAFAGFGISPLKNLSFGFNFLYYFGSLDYNNDIQFPITFTSYSDSYSRTSYQVHDFNFNLGMQYVAYFDKEENTNITLGATYQFGKKLSTTQKWFTTIEGNFVDSLFPHPDYESYIDFPWSINTGIAFTFKDKLTVLGEYYMQDWTKTTPFNSDSPLAKMESIRIGIEYTPNRRDLKKYFNKVNYRLGFYSNKSNLVVAGNQINDFGITFGAGLPLKGKTKVNLSFEIGWRGTNENYLIKENYGALNLSFTFYDYPWFFKRKYN
ncbi:hypothetical protein [Tenuifilum thalassicum]|uniref:Uncharacterized protein n=1 Tax=Tenuifilum thalassicum TaxID=2590900 RepID=A0A7D4BD86_9BACT|nr:hypothetical protein [Tenuifilum thalassicum]QKG79098.1 hypothetical protein FHG85_02060 [Tenuifilum thalassicum]